jgi:hypothetical protein
MILAPAGSRLAHGTMLILLTTSLSVLIAQIDTSVVNLAVKEIGAWLGAGVTALGGRRLQSRLIRTGSCFGQRRQDELDLHRAQPPRRARSPVLSATLNT